MTQSAARVENYRLLGAQGPVLNPRASPPPPPSPSRSEVLPTGPNSAGALGGEGNGQQSLLGLGSHWSEESHIPQEWACLTFSAPRSHWLGVAIGGKAVEQGLEWISELQGGALIQLCLL